MSRIGAKMTFEPYSVNCKTCPVKWECFEYKYPNGSPETRCPLVRLLRQLEEEEEET